MVQNNGPHRICTICTKTQGELEMGTQKIWICDSLWYDCSTWVSLHLLNCWHTCSFYLTEISARPFFSLLIHDLYYINYEKDGLANFVRVISAAQDISHKELFKGESSDLKNVLQHRLIAHQMLPTTFPKIKLDHIVSSK